MMWGLWFRKRSNTAMPRKLMNKDRKRFSVFLPE
jgi:hypothetical protein